MSLKPLDTTADSGRVVLVREVVLVATIGATVSIREAAERLAVHENTVRNWIDRGYLRAYRLPSGHRRLPEGEVARLMQEVFAVPASVPEDQPSAAPKAWDSEPVYRGRLPE